MNQPTKGKGDGWEYPKKKKRGRWARKNKDWQVKPPRFTKATLANQGEEGTSSSHPMEINEDSTQKIGEK